MFVKYKVYLIIKRFNMGIMDDFLWCIGNVYNIYVYDCMCIK